MRYTGERIKPGCKAYLITVDPAEVCLEHFAHGQLAALTDIDEFTVPLEKDT
jgi:hypothetical protein